LGHFSAGAIGCGEQRFPGRFLCKNCSPPTLHPHYAKQLSSCVEWRVSHVLSVSISLFTSALADRLFCPSKMGVIPYEVGHTLTLQFVGDDATRSVYIEHVYGPATMSVVLRVRLLDDPSNDCGLRNGDDAILKLHDRRFAVDMRTSPPYRAKEFDQELEDRYLEYLRNFNFDCESDQEKTQNTPDRESEPTTADVETEADIQNRCLELAKAEEEIYHRLRPFQDRGQIPHYYAAVELLLDSHLPRLEDVPEKQLSAIQEYLRVPGALIEYVDGRPLREIGDFVPKDEWRYVIQSAMSTVNEWGDYGVLNSDVRLDNVLVQRLPNPLYEGMFLNKVVHFDFAQARIRAEDENDLDWKHNK
jgi:hypothetical protein